MILFGRLLSRIFERPLLLGFLSRHSCSYSFCSFYKVAYFGIVISEINSCLPDNGISPKYRSFIFFQCLRSHWIPACLMFFSWTQVHMEEDGYLLLRSCFSSLMDLCQSGHPPLRLVTLHHFIGLPLEVIPLVCVLCEVGTEHIQHKTALGRISSYAAG